MTSRIHATMRRAGRAALLVAALAVALGAALGATTALAAVPGDPLRLGQLNTINALTTLAGNRAGALLQIKNDGGPALNLTVPAGQPPAVISAGAGKVTNLNADTLDGKDAAAFVPTKTYFREATGAGKANSFNSLSIACDPGDFAISGGYEGVDGTDTVVFASRPVENGWIVTWKSGPLGGDGLKTRVRCADVA